MQNNISIQQLEDKYVDSAIECLIKIETQNGIFKAENEENYKQFFEYITGQFRYDVRIFKTIIIAIDNSKKDYVCGVHLSVDFAMYVMALQKENKVEQIHLQKEMALKVIKPLIDLNYTPGEMIIGTKFGVREEYRNQHIEEQLYARTLQNAADLGFTYQADLVYDTIEAQIASKSAKVVTHVKVDNLTELPEKYRNQLHTKEVYIFAKQIKDVNPTKLPPFQQNPVFC